MPEDTPLSPAQRFGPVPPPSYRPARPQPTGSDPATRSMVIAAGCVAALLLALVAGWAITSRHGGVVPLIAADKQPLRVKPDNPGGMQVAGAYEVSDLPGQAAVTTPGPETPAPEALRAAQPEAPTSPPQEQPPQAASQPAPEASAPDVAQPAAPPAPAAPPTAAPVRKATMPQLRAPDRPAASAASAGTFVQLAAVDSEAGARTEWQRIKGRIAGIIADRQPAFQRAERDGRAFWRIRIGGFSSIADATRFCERVRGKGGACELATF